MRTRIHAVSGVLALMLVAAAFLASATVEVLQHLPAIVYVKRLNVFGIALLIPLLAVSGMSGVTLIGKRRGRLMQTKQRRSLVSAVTSLLILAPCAVTLSMLAARGQVHGGFYALQALEFVVEGLTLALLSLNMRDGLRLTGRLKKPVKGTGKSAAGKTVGSP